MLVCPNQCQLSYFRLETYRYCWSLLGSPAIFNWRQSWLCQKLHTHTWSTKTCSEAPISWTKIHQTNYSKIWRSRNLRIFDGSTRQANTEIWICLPSRTSSYWCWCQCICWGYILANQALCQLVAWNIWSCPFFNLKLWIWARYSCLRSKA